MPAIRRLYLYLVSFVSLEVILWGMIGLLRSIFSSGEIGGDAALLAGALSLILVGVPVFALHWWLAQRLVRLDPQERSARLRAIFLYGVLLATGIPVAQNILAAAARLALAALSISPRAAFLGGDQSTVDNLVGIIANGVAFAYFYHELRTGWEARPEGDAFTETRRLYRYIWVLYGLGLVVFGTQSILSFLFTALPSVGEGPLFSLGNGLALLLVGVPAWVLSTQVVQASLVSPEERSSLLRLVILYGLVFLSVIVVLVTSGLILQTLLSLLFAGQIASGALSARLGEPVSGAVPFGLIWVYYGRILTGEMSLQPGQPRRAGLKRLYYYGLSLFGLAATWVGAFQLLGFLVRLAFADLILGRGALVNSLADALALLLVGVPLWVLNWGPVAKEAAQEGEAGDHARRSLVRKAYLYLVIFVGVIGVMGSVGVLFYGLLSALLGAAPENLLLDAAQQLKSILLFALLLIYHLRALRADGQAAEKFLARRHAQFPVLILAPGEASENGSPAKHYLAEGGFGAVLVEALRREAPDLPVAVHPYSQGTPDPALSAARAVILPAELLARPSEALRLWLQGYTGERIVIPTPADNWLWIGGSGYAFRGLAHQAAQAVSHLAEEEEIPRGREGSPFMIAVYIFAGLFALELSFGLVMLGISFFLR